MLALAADVSADGKLVAPGGPGIFACFVLRRISKSLRDGDRGWWLIVVGLWRRGIARGRSRSGLAKLKPGVRMALPASAYIDTENGACRIFGTRVGLDCVIHEYQAGRAREQIVESFPTVTLAQAYGAIAYYLENKQLIDDFFAEVYRKFEQRVRPLSETNPERFARLEAVRPQLGSKCT